MEPNTVEREGRYIRRVMDEGKERSSGWRGNREESPHQDQSRIKRGERRGRDEDRGNHDGRERGQGEPGMRREDGRIGEYRE